MKKNATIWIYVIGLGLITSCSIQSDYSKYVNVFIGTGGHGHTFPGATVPFGMVQLSPDTRMSGWDACSGYHYSDSTIIGFSHTHLSGTGIGDYGDILLMPTVGNQKLVRGDETVPGSGYRSRFSKKTETASPGYYSVKLDDYNVTAELTATTRAGFHRYTFPESAKSGIILDLDHTLQNHYNTLLELKVLSDSEIQGLKVTRGWAKKHFVYFYAKFSKPFRNSIAVNDSIRNFIDETNGHNLKALLTFETKKDEQILVKVGISAVDYAGAKNNLDNEIPDWNFDKVRKQAVEKWNKELSKVKIKGGSENQRTIFYTALYHTMISPNVFSDFDGRYRGMDQEIHNSKGSSIYSVFSLWDTFRAAQPLMTILNPSCDAAMIRSLLKKYDEGGILPMWELAGNYTGTMIGYHSVPVIVDAYNKGIRDFDVEKAYQAMIKSSHFDTLNIKAPTKEILGLLMPAAKLYNDSLGYVPCDRDNEAVAKALEYAYDDWCIGLMAKALGKEEDYKVYSERALRYKKYFDPATGFMRGVTLKGEWRTPFNPKYSNHREDDYCEGNAWQWTWFVPHDVQGLIALMGGKNSFVIKLDSLFTIDSKIEGENISADISGMIGQYAHGNEPSHHISHLYNYVGQPWKTEKLVDSILQTLYLNNPDGLSGNEDCGQMSAWYVLNAMGFYSVAPGNPVYSIGRPLFNSATINLENGKSFKIEAADNSGENKYIQSATLNGAALNTPFFKHDDIVKGGTLVLKMGPEPNTKWGVAGN